MHSQVIRDIEQQLYLRFVGSSKWDEGLQAIKQVSLEAAEAVNQYGIGSKLTHDDQYDFESGQLLDDMPKEIRDSQAVQSAYEAICDLAHAYADYVRKN